MSNQGVVDWHIHTRYSSCCKEDYGVAEVWDAAEQAGLAGAGLSDHSNYPSFNANFVRSQREDIMNFGFQDNVRVGLEISIIDRKGKLGVNPKILGLLDFVMIAEHLHIARPFSEFSNVKKKILKWVESGDNVKVQDLEQRTLELMCAGMQVNNGVTILAHPWRFFLSRRIYDPLLLDLTPRLCEVAQDRGVAIEMPGTHLGILTDREQNLPFWDFVREFWRLVSRYDVRISFGSDAHRLDKIGHFENLTSALNEFGLSPRRLLTLADVPCKLAKIAK
ncbi:MAG TPA: hypothetical protein VKK79_00725 [Candidatus Lokiarchaeia archaeon]|nr:hypothetical protein [Candidatus Lokiarchaeia archaeon]